MQSRIRLFLLLLGVVLAAFGNAAKSEARVILEAVHYSGWDGAYRLTNGTVDVVIVPAIARIMRYGYVGGPNLLWNNPTAAGLPARPGDWPNFGGDKAWPWPQDEWPQHIGHDWPPPAAADQAPYTTEIVGTDTIRMTSALVIGFDLRIVRDITLAPTGTRLTVVTHLEKIGAGKPVSVAAWAITQVNAPDTILARLVANSSLPDGWKQLGFDPFAAVKREGELLRITLAREKSSKIGMDAARLAAVFGETLLTIRSSLASGAGDYLSGESAQIYAGAENADDLKRGITPYVELELTSPKRTLTNPGDTVTLTTIWELRKLPTGADAATAFLSGEQNRPGVK